MSKIGLQLFGAFTIFNIVCHSIPLDKLSSFVAHRHGTRLEPVVLSVRAATQSGLILQRTFGSQRFLPLFENSAEIVGMKCSLPTPAQGLFLRQPCIFDPATVYEYALAVRHGNER